MSEDVRYLATEDLSEGTVVRRKSYSPERISFGPGSEAIVDVTDDSRTVGLLSAEGRSGMLVATDRNHVQFLEMSPGLFSAEHAHTYGFIIYTIKGRWVVCSYGRRCMMAPGSIYACGPNVPMGMEVPFEDGAFLLFFLEGGIKTQRRYEDYLRGVSNGGICHKVTEMMHIKDLPSSHPARIFAERVNPGYLERC